MQNIIEDKSVPSPFPVGAWGEELGKYSESDRKWLLHAASVEKMEVNFLAADDNEQKLLRKFLRQEKKIPSLAELLALNSNSLLERRGWGKTAAKRLAAFQLRLSASLLENRDNLLSLVQDNSKPAPIVFRKVANFDLGWIDEALVADMDYGLACLSEEMRTIARGRWAYQSEAMSLEEIGMKFDKTRERVRQLQEDFNRTICISLRVGGQFLRHNLKRFPESSASQLLPKFFARFTNQKRFYQFLDMCCGLTGKESFLESQWIDFQQISLGELEAFYASVAGPYNRVDLLLAIQNIYKFSPLQAGEWLDHLICIGRLVPSGGGLYPHGLHKNIAVAHALLSYPEGLHWTQVYREIQRKNLLRVQLNDQRLDASFTENQFIYLVNQGTYCHRRFMKVSSAQAEKLISWTRSRLSLSPGEKFHLLGLWQELCSQQGEVCDYFHYRHVISVYGEKFGVYFSGASRNDTVSMEENAVKKTSRSDVLNVLIQAGCVLHYDEIMSRLGRRGSSLVLNALYALREERQVVFLGRQRYATLDVAFAKLNIAKASDLVIATCKSRDGIARMETLVQVLNQKFGLQESRSFYSAFLRMFGSLNGWTVESGRVKLRSRA
ncbi:MAG: hypothetical protein OXT67_11970 [Zetaproteobacteria bacterium]|nr:hypothetical protein [Zetaproteobacteria bacterium]